jgi:hypothetical protein
LSVFGFEAQDSKCTITAVAATLLTGDYFNLYTIVLSYKTWGEKNTIYIAFACLIFSQALSFKAFFINITKTLL